ncbi:DEAD/DEAH box helicase [Actinopolymorpha alba]|uniref:DEAD/DEAH box helicase n=1 Tax=Actinopolymorpha alba TaxID=533267 RepID=UPI001ED99FBF|nr:DEAD/DEAH box helicase [Actinopolymorpha alba]
MRPSNVPQVPVGFEPVGVEAVFVPADPPRTGTIALWEPSRAGSGSGNAAGSGGDATVEVVLPAGSRVRRSVVPARLLTIAEAIDHFTAEPDPMAPVSHRAWGAAALAGLGLVAHGKLAPARSPQGFGAWRVGPLDPADHAWLRELAAAMPPLAHAVPITGSRPVRIHTAEGLIRAFWDAIADTLARPDGAYADTLTNARTRTSPRPLAAKAEPFALPDPARLDGPTDWLDEIEQFERAGARLVLRIEPPSGGVDEVEPVDEEPEPVDTEAGSFRGLLRLRSTTDPSLLVDVADLWTAPAAVLTRLGAQAETDLLLALRRGARAWPPLGTALTAATPTGVDLGDDDLEDLLTRGAEALDGAGIEVLWPTELFGTGLKLRARAATPTPAGAAQPTFSMRDLLTFRWQPTIDGEALTDDEIAALAEAKRPFLWLRGRWVKVDRDVLARLRRRTPRTLGAAEALAAALTGELEVDEERVEFTAEGPVAQLAERLRAAESDLAISTPADLQATLRPYQQRGLAWLAHLTGLGLGGCLADDMGLGKTLQLIALHLHRRPLGQGPTLVVCPTSLLGTWQRELAKFAPTIPVRRFHGAGRHLDETAPDEVVLTTYGVVRRDHDELATATWGMVVADEAQHAKNPLARTARALRSIPSATRVALTGTPVENHLTELWSILDWTTPGILGSLDRFRRRLAVPIERYRDPDATARLGRLSRPFLLRRRKSDPGIAPELPPKTESDVVVPLTTEQATLYKAVVDEVMEEIRSSEGMARRGLVLALLTALKQVCNHPAQYLHEAGPLPGRSGKLAALDELLDVILAEGESVLVFSQYVEMCQLLQGHLDARGVRTLFLHGGVGAKKREQLVTAFQAGEAPVFLLSLKAGGVGLTLTQATHVVHFDRWWNPAVEDQATDRAYRIGQDRPVQVHRLVTEGTLEDRIADLMRAKRDLADAVVGSGEAWLTELSDAELADLVALGSPT